MANLTADQSTNLFSDSIVHILDSIVDDVIILLISLLHLCQLQDQFKWTQINLCTLFQKPAIRHATDFGRTFAYDSGHWISLMYYVPRL